MTKRTIGFIATVHLLLTRNSWALVITLLLLKLVTEYMKQSKGQAVPDVLNCIDGVELLLRYNYYFRALSYYSNPDYSNLRTLLRLHERKMHPVSCR